MSHRRVAAVVVATAAVLLLSQPALAGIVQGSIANVDLAGNKIHIVQPDGKIFVFAHVPGTTKVTRNGKPYKFELLQIGWKATVQFNDSTRVALKIDAVDL